MTSHQPAAAVHGVVASVQVRCLRALMGESAERARLLKEVGPAVLADSSADALRPKTRDAMHDMLEAEAALNDFWVRRRAAAAERARRAGRFRSLSVSEAASAAASAAEQDEVEDDDASSAFADGACSVAPSDEGERTPGPSPSPPPRPTEGRSPLATTAKRHSVVSSATATSKRGGGAGRHARAAASVTVSRRERDSLTADEAALVEELEMCAHDSQRTVLRAIGEDPLLASMLGRRAAGRRGASDGGPPAGSFLDVYRLLGQLLGTESGVSEEDEQAALQRLEEATAVEKQMRERLKELQERLEETEKEHRRTVGEKTRHVARLRGEIEGARRENVATDGVYMGDARARHGDGYEAFAAAEAELLARVDELKARLGEQGARFTGEEQQLHRRKAVRREAVGDIIAKYDRDMGDTHARLTALRATYEVETEERLRLQEHFDKIDAETERKAREVAAARAAMLKDAAVVLARTQTAMVVQAMCRQFHSVAAASADGADGAAASPSGAGKRRK